MFNNHIETCAQKDNELVKISFKKASWFSDNTFLVSLNGLFAILNSLDESILSDIQIFESQFCSNYPNNQDKDKFLSLQKLVVTPRLIIMIIHSTDHWQLQWIDFSSPQNTQWYFYCPLGRPRKKAETNFILELFPKLYRQSPLPRRCISINGPKQKNGSDCGPFVMSALIYVLSGRSHNTWCFSQADMPFLRETLSALHQKDDVNFRKVVSKWSAKKSNYLTQYFYNISVNRPPVSLLEDLPSNDELDRNLPHTVESRIPLSQEIKTSFREINFNPRESIPAGYSSIHLRELRNFMRTRYGLRSDTGAAHFLCHFRSVSNEDESLESERDFWLELDVNDYKAKDFTVTYDIDSALLSTKKMVLKKGTVMQLFSFMEISSAITKNNHCFWNVEGVFQPIFRIPNVLLAACGQVTS